MLKSHKIATSSWARDDMGRHPTPSSIILNNFAAQCLRVQIVEMLKHVRPTWATGNSERDTETAYSAPAVDLSWSFSCLCQTCQYTKVIQEPWRPWDALRLKFEDGLFTAFRQAQTKNKNQVDRIMRQHDATTGFSVGWGRRCVKRQLTPWRDLSGDSCRRRHVSITTRTWRHSSALWTTEISVQHGTTNYIQAYQLYSTYGIIWNPQRAFWLELTYQDLHSIAMTIQYQ